MRSIGIVTVNGNGNYGNRLQNFALQEVLRSVGFDSVTTIRNVPRLGEGGRAFSRGLSHFKEQGFHVVLPWIRGRLGGFVSDQASEPSHFLGNEREEAIKGFVVQHIQESAADYSDPPECGGLGDSFDYFIAGSDQIWHPMFGLRDHLRFLSFADPHKRVAYSASMGVPEIPGHLKRAYREGVRGMAHVSVREARAAELIAQHVGRRVPVTLDPTMLISPERWRDLAVCPPSLQGGGYAAEFFLSPPDAHAMCLVRDYVSRKGWASVDLREDAHEDLRALGPLELLGSIRDANLVVTDSFHVAVFSTMFQVPFLLHGRGDMNSRFDTLLDKSGLEMPRWGSFEEIDASIDIDWNAVAHRISRERLASLEFLKGALNRP